MSDTRRMTGLQQAERGWRAGRRGSPCLDGDPSPAPGPGGLLALVVMVFALSPAFIFAPLAEADILRLKNGNTIEGRVSVLPDGNYHVMIEEGRSLTIPRDDVVEVTAREAPIDVFERRIRRVGEKDRAGLVELAAWAEEKGLPRSALEVYRRILRADPHHRGARSRLGYALYRNRWVPREELEGRGLRLFRGIWMTPEEVGEGRAREAVEEFRTLLRDANHENRFLRENAMVQMMKWRDPALVPFLKDLLRSEDPLERMLAARVLGNQAFEAAARSIYEALGREAREETRTAMAVVLRSFGRGEAGAWLGRDLLDPPLDEPQRLRNLLRFAEECPHRAAVPGLIALVDDPRWGALAARLLERLLGVSSRGAAAWRAFWRERGAAAPVDLGSGWVRAL
ncbi:MAG: hypothetical protein ACE5GW_08565 [Planctomycetota bacterium]